MAIKYHTYRYAGTESRIGLGDYTIKRGDTFCIIDEDRARINTLLVGNVDFTLFLHESDYVGDYNISDYLKTIDPYYSLTCLSA